MSASAPFIDYPVLQVRPNTLLVYTRREWNPVVLDVAKKHRAAESAAKKKKPLPQPDLFSRQIFVNYLPALMNVSTGGASKPKSNPENFKGKKAYSGEITEHSRKRLRRAINLLIAQAKWKTAIDYETGQPYKFLINFITLTLSAPQGKHTDKSIKSKILDPFLKKAKRKWNLKSYVWRAERQENGNIHFHIASDIFIPYDQLKTEWNLSQEALGFISAFEKKKGHRHPNSTDVHAVKNINNLAGYILKYMSKEIATTKDLALIRGCAFAHGSRAKLKAAKLLSKIYNLSDVPLSGKVWDCSLNLKVKKNCELFLENETEKIWNEERKNNPRNVTDLDKCSYITFKRPAFLKMLRGPIKARWNEFIEGIRNHTRQIQDPPSPEINTLVPPIPCPF